MIIQRRADEKHYGVAALGNPKKRELQYCEILGKDVATLVKKLNR
jgi:hypothetical protein